jgi:pimeloyl-ACP methyl ester carboxylesterase
MQTPTHSEDELSTEVSIPAGRVTLIGDLVVPPSAEGVIVFAHGSGSSRTSPRNRAVAAALVCRRFATLLFDLLTREEEVAERYTRHLRFDIPLLAGRLMAAIAWLGGLERTAQLPIGLFGASTGAAAALIAAARIPKVAAVVSRGGRPDLADIDLPNVRAPTLLIVGGDDVEVLELNRRARRRLTTEASLHIVPGATHLFEEHGALAEVTSVAGDWFHEHLSRAAELRPDEQWDH